MYGGQIIGHLVGDDILLFFLRCLLGCLPQGILIHKFEVALIDLLQVLMLLALVEEQVGEHKYLQEISQGEYYITHNNPIPFVPRRLIYAINKGEDAILRVEQGPQNSHEEHEAHHYDDENV